MNWFLEVFNDFQTQQDLDVETLKLFNKISSEEIWKNWYENINQAKKQLNKDYIKIQDKFTEAQSQLWVTRNDTSFFSISFRFIKHFQKLFNLFTFTDESEFIWNDWQKKIHDKLKINVDHFDNDKAILVHIHSWIDENVVKVTLA